MSRRRAPTLADKCASALLALGQVPYEHAKQMTAQQLLSLYQFDHNIRHAEDGPAEFWNLAPTLIAEHRRKTATLDVPGIAKNKRIRAKLDLHKLKLAQRWIVPEARKERMLERPRMASRPFARRRP